MIALKTYRFIFSVLLITTIPFAGLTQPPDAVWIPRSDALRKLAQADSLIVYKDIVKEKENEIKLLDLRIANMLRLVAELQATDAANVSAIDAYKREIEELKGIKVLMESDYNTMKGILKKQKRKTFWTAIAGILATAGSVIFLLR
jgi:hypothetical protein